MRPSKNTGCGLRNDVLSDDNMYKYSPIWNCEEDFFVIFLTQNVQKIYCPSPLLATNQNQKPLIVEKSLKKTSEVQTEHTEVETNP